LSNVLYELGYIDAAERLNEEAETIYNSEKYLELASTKWKPLTYILQNVIRKKENTEFAVVRKRYEIQSIGKNKGANIMQDNFLRPDEIAWIVLCDSLGSANHCVGVCNEFIYDGSETNALVLSHQSLDEICSTTQKKASYISIWEGYRFIRNDLPPPAEIIYTKA
jgi:hypothetical protein